VDGVDDDAVGTTNIELTFFFVVGVTCVIEFKFVIFFFYFVLNQLN
jgi:hypothetical protein